MKGTNAGRIALLALVSLCGLVALALLYSQVYLPENDSQPLAHESQESLSTPVYWSTEGWKSSTPEEQGVNSAILAEGLQAIRDNDIHIHSLLVIRNSSVVLDAYFYPYNGKTPHELASVTKSLMTTLIAIAADQGKLQLDQPMVFQGYSYRYYQLVTFSKII
jgi:hypothetical protein